MTLYKTSTCAYCPIVMRYLDKLGAKYQVVDCTEDISLLEPAIKLSGAFSFPQVVAGDRVVVGYNAAQLASLLS